MKHLTRAFIPAGGPARGRSSCDWGAEVSFTGRVRGTEGGRKLPGLDYSAFEPLAEREIERIILEVREATGVAEITVLHRLGFVPAGELAVWVSARSPHRAAAFEACQSVMDEIKSRVPIWKKEVQAAPLVLVS